VARRVLERAGRHLGVGIANLVNIFNPEVVVVGGGAVEAGELLLGPAREVVGERALRPSRDLVRIRAAHHGPEAGMLGAALLAFDGLAERSSDGGVRAGAPSP
jgi:glucokinase